MQSLEHNGCHLAFKLTGQGSPVLMIQGVGVHGDGWLPQVEALSQDYRCLTFDNRGLAGSQPLGPEKLTVELMAEDALALVEGQGWDEFHVVGHSMGGHIATALALRAPRRIRSLALLCTSARGRDMPPLTLSLLWTSIRCRLGTRRKRRHAFLEMVLPPAMRKTVDLDVWSDRLTPIFGHDLAKTPSIAIRQVRAYRRYDPTARLAELRDVPTLVVSAEHDPLGPPSLGRALAAAIPGARYLEMKEASHGVTATHSAQVNTLLAEHFSSVERNVPVLQS